MLSTIFYALIGSEILRIVNITTGPSDMVKCVHFLQCICLEVSKETAVER